MKKITYCALLFFMSCNNNQGTNDNVSYFEGKDLWEKKCSSCHSFLTFEDLNQTSLSQMRELQFENLYEKIKSIKNDTNHTRPSLNIKDVNGEDIKKITLYIKKTGEPKP